MSEMKHTPGPWIVLENDCIFGADGYPVAAADGKADIQRGCGECKANAAFIVRACNCFDDLLEALSAITRDCREVLAGREPLTLNLIHAIVNGKALAAIAKAQRI